jgi:predicted component of type VI protein secretion system
MYLVKLFHQSDPLRPVETRMTPEGVIRVGRDPASDWVVRDEECEISRNHLELHLRAGRLMLRPLGTNGVFHGASAERLQDESDVPLGVGDRFRFGRYSMLIEACPFAGAPRDGAARTMILSAPLGESAIVPSEWSDAVEPQDVSDTGSLLEAFCQGAKLDASAFSTEDPAEVMRQAGAVYRQMVLGLAALMSERSNAKSQYGMDRTTIGARENNPFKWAPTQRLAIDLLLKKDCGFLSGAAAIKASFEDLKRHLLSTLAGYRASLRALVDTTEPQAIHKGLQKESLFQSRDAACWGAFQTLHQSLARQISDDEDGPLNRAFTSAYAERMRELERDSAR